MIRIEIPGRTTLKIEYLLLDYNGTIAYNGIINSEVAKLLLELKDKLDIWVLTADTYGTAKAQCSSLGVQLKTYPKENAGQSKLEFLNTLKEGVCCIGNGYNDIKMCKKADLSIAVIGQEGASTKLLMSCEVAVTSPEAALQILLKPEYLKATLRN